MSGSPIRTMRQSQPTTDRRAPSDRLVVHEALGAMTSQRSTRPSAAPTRPKNRFSSHSPRHCPRLWGETDTWPPPSCEILESRSWRSGDGTEDGRRSLEMAEIQYSARSCQHGRIVHHWAGFADGSEFISPLNDLIVDAQFCHLPRWVLVWLNSLPSCRTLGHHEQYGVPQ